MCFSVLFERSGDMGGEGDDKDKDVASPRPFQGEAKLDKNKLNPPHCGFMDAEASPLFFFSEINKINKKVGQVK